MTRTAIEVRSPMLDTLELQCGPMYQSWATQPAIAVATTRSRLSSPATAIAVLPPIRPRVRSPAERGRDMHDVFMRALAGDHVAQVDVAIAVQMPVPIIFPDSSAAKCSAAASYIKTGERAECTCSSA